MARKTTTKTSRGKHTTQASTGPKTPSAGKSPPNAKSGTTSRRKSTTKKSATGKAVTKKPTKKSTTKKATTKKSVVKKSTTKKPTKKTTAKPTAKKSPVKKSTTKRSAASAATQVSSLSRRIPDLSTREGQAAQAVAMGQTLSASQLRKAKSGLGRKELAAYRALLFEKRAELLGDVASLQNDVNEKSGNLSNMPLHMADVGSDHYEQEFSLGLMESERKLLREIDDAIMRIGDGTYGVCVVSGLPIGAARLDAKPWAKYCIEVVREREKRGQY